MKNRIAVQQLRLPTPLGEMLLAASARGLAGAWFTHNQQHGPDASCWPEAPAHPLLQRAAQQLDEYFAGRRSAFDLPLDLSGGTAFQQAVWSALLEIGFSSACSYGSVATAIGRPNAVRAVGAAVGRNPVALIVPCHRVVGSNGSLTGYGGGLERKVALLVLERRDLASSIAAPGAAA